MSPAHLIHLMPLAELIGYVAATLTTAAFVPQAWQSWRTRDLSGISLGMYAGFTVGVALWLVYGWLLRAWPIILANAVTLSLAALILGLKLRSRDGLRSGSRRRRRRRPA